MTVSPISPACPQDDQLRAFCAATLPAAQMDAVEDHLRTCDSCLTALDVFDEESDTLVQVLSTLPSNNDDEPALVRAREGLLLESVDFSPGEQPTCSLGDTSRTEELPEVPSSLGGYELIELIGRGASGAVFQARHTRLDRVVAIKILSSRYVRGDDQAVARFAQEMRAVGRLDHPHIVKATDAGEDAGRHYLVMEYIDGVDVSRLLRFTGPLRVADACEIVRQAAQALQFAHDSKLVHRDVKPSNLLFTSDGEIKLLDLGLASIDDDDALAARSEIPFGTGDYMSPEQWTNFEGVDARADIYSLGCTLYKLLTGEAVFPAERRNHNEKMESHLRSRIPSVRTLRPEVPLGLQRIITKMLAKRPEDRYQTAQEVEQHLSTYAIEARLKSLSDRIAAVPREQFFTDPPRTTVDENMQRRRTRRQVLVAASAFTPLAIAGLLLNRRRNDVKLQTDISRPLRPTSSARSYPSSITELQNPAAELSVAADNHDVTLRTRCASAVDLGKPVSGRFQLRSTIRCHNEPQHVGLFFRYRPRKTKTSRVHPFQVIEIAHDGEQLRELCWGQYRYFENGDGTFEVDRKPWARVAIEGSTQQPHDLQITLGKTGFPQVAWNGIRFKQAAWTIDWEGMHASQLTRNQLAFAFLGGFGLFVERGDASFSQMQLAYLD